MIFGGYYSGSYTGNGQAVSLLPGSLFSYPSLSLFPFPFSLTYLYSLDFPLGYANQIASCTLSASIQLFILVLLKLFHAGSFLARFCDLRRTTYFYLSLFSSYFAPFFLLFVVCFDNSLLTSCTEKNPFGNKSLYAIIVSQLIVEHNMYHEHLPI